MFQSAAKIYIKDPNKGVMGSQTILDGFGGGSKLVENEMEIIKSPALLEEVLRENRFNIRYFEKGRLGDFEVYEKRAVEINILSDSAQVGNYFFDILRKNNSDVEVKFTDESRENHSIQTRFGQAFQAGKDRFSLAYFPKKNDQNITGFKIEVDSIPELAYVKSDLLKTGLLNNKASVFVIVNEDGIARRAADFLNAVLKKYSEFTLDDKNQTALNSIKFIDSRLQNLGDELGTIEKDVESFKTTRGITQIDENSQLFLQQAKDADQKLQDAQIQLSVYDQLEKFVNDENPVAQFTPVIGNVDAALTSLINRYQDQLSSRRRLSLSVQPNGTLGGNLNQQIEETRKSIKDYIQGYRRNAVEVKSGLQKKVNQIEGRIANVPKYERQFLNLQRQQSVKNTLYTYLLQKKEENAIAYASNIVDNKIISAAFIPRTPVKPQKTVVMIAFVLAGIVLASAYLLMKYVGNKKIHSKTDIEQALSLPVIAEIFTQKHEKEASFFDGGNRSVLREQMLNLRSNLKFLLANVNHTPAILFTSTISGEGKTFLSAHLGNSLTGNKKKVVLVELDLRKPKLAKSLGVANEKGLSNYLLGEITESKLLNKVPGSENLFLISSGPVPPNPVELIESPRMAELFETLRKQFDYIIVDTAPLGLVADAKSLLPHVDCALFVTRFNYTPKAKLSETGAVFENMDFKNTAIIFNGIEPDNSYGYYSYGYGSGNGYGYGYYGGKEENSVVTFMKRFWQRVF